MPVVGVGIATNLAAGGELERHRRER
jgi:hypothetical protein